MHAFLRQTLNDLKTELAQFNAIASQFGMSRDHPQHIPGGRVGIHAQEQVRGRKIEKAEGMRLHDLGAVQQFAQFPRRRRDAHGHDRVTGFRRG